MAIIETVKSEGKESTEGLTGHLSFEQDNNRIIGRDNDSIPRLLILADGTEFVMKVSETGINVTTASNDQLIFNSGQNIFKIVDSGTKTVSNTSTWAQLNPGKIFDFVAHGQSSPPATLVYIDSPTVTGVGGLTDSNAPGLSASPVVLYAASPGGNSIPLLLASSRVDSTNIYFEVINLTSLTTGWPTLTWTFKYYILSETAS